MLFTRHQKNSVRNYLLRVFPSSSGVGRTLLILAKYLRLVGVLRYPGENDFFRNPGTSPKASIIIPTFNNCSLTLRCLHNIQLSNDITPYEIIVVDDGSTWLHRWRLRKVSGIKVLKIEESVGYLRACNAGLNIAQGEIIILLNNDTLPQDLWLDSLIANFDVDDVGLVGAKLIYPNGLLQEAGGIIYSDGSAANYGRGQNPDDPRFNYRRDTDYCSGAAIGVRKELFTNLGGYDTRYEDAYYEDTDLAMSIRDLGYRVVYEPKSAVIHFEHGSYSADKQGRIDTLMAANRIRFSKKWKKELTRHSSKKNADSFDAVMRASKTNGTILVFDNPPRWNHDSGAKRLRGILDYYLSLNFRIVLVSDNPKVEANYASWLYEQGIQVLSSGDARLPSYLSTITPDLKFVHVARVGYMRLFKDRFASILNDVPLIFDTVDLHFLRNEREKKYKAQKLPRRVLQDLSLAREEELNFIRAADITLVVSQVEAEMLLKYDLHDDVFVVPNVHEKVQKHISRSSRTDIVFVGNFHHGPNIDGITWFHSEIYPRICSQIGEIPLKVVGSPSPKFRKTHSANGLQVLGWIEDIEKVYENALIAIAPLRFGAGVKGKIGEAWAHGVPVVSTSIGAEGMFTEIDHVGLIADSPEEFADKTVKLITNTALWQQASSNSQKFVDENFGVEAFTQKMNLVTKKVMQFSDEMRDRTKDK